MPAFIPLRRDRPMNNRRRFVFAFALAVWISSSAVAQDKKDPPKAKDANPLLVNDPRACQGYTLIPPLQSKTTFLVDMQGRIVHTWESAYTAGLSAYLLDNGNLSGLVAILNQILSLLH